DRRSGGSAGGKTRDQRAYPDRVARRGRRLEHPDRRHRHQPRMGEEVGAADAAIPHERGRLMQTIERHELATVIGGNGAKNLVGLAERVWKWLGPGAKQVN